MRKFLEEKKCAECGKLFYVQDCKSYVYKKQKSYLGLKYYCSWSCYRADEKRKELKNGKK